MQLHDQISTTHSYRVSPRTLIFLYNQDHLLLLRGAPTKHLWPNRYNGLGGHIQPGEDVQHAALREVYEETGFPDIPTLTMRGILHIPIQLSTGIMIFVFTAALANELTPYPSHEGLAEWLDWRTLPQEKLVPDLPILLPYIERRMADNLLFTATYRLDETQTLHISLNPPA